MAKRKKAVQAKARAGKRSTKPGRKSAKKAVKATKARAEAVAPATGPVTLDEAVALAQIKRPELAVQAVRATAAPPSPAAVGAERAKLRKEQREEHARRIREYKATMTIMKARGARRPRLKGFKAGEGEPTAEDAESFVPLQILAEGDSWFDYPAFIGGGIIPRLSWSARCSHPQSRQGR